MMYLKQFISLVLLSVGFASIAGEQVDKRLVAEDVSRITIDNPRGKVKILGWKQSEVHLSGELDEEAKKLVFEQQGNRIKIKVVVPDHHGHNNNNKGSDLMIKLPQDVRVEFQSISADVTANNLIAGADIETVSGDVKAGVLKELVEVKTVSGDIKLNSAQGKINLSSVSGNIVSAELNGDIALSTISGHIEDKHSQGQLQLKVVSGDIDSQSNAVDINVKNVSGNTRLKLNQVNELVASTVSGDLTASLSLNDDGYVKASGVSGDIKLKFQSDIQANFKLHASAGGDIENDISADRPVKAKYGPSTKLQFQTGNGSGAVKVSTVSGEITVAK